MREMKKEEVWADYKQASHPIPDSLFLKTKAKFGLFGSHSLLPH